jgi:hypothetical protein
MQNPVRRCTLRPKPENIPHNLRMILRVVELLSENRLSMSCDSSISDRSLVGIPLMSSTGCPSNERGGQYDPLKEIE